MYRYTITPPRITRGWAEMCWVWYGVKHGNRLRVCFPPYMFVCVCCCCVYLGSLFCPCWVPWPRPSSYIQEAWKQVWDHLEAPISSQTVCHRGRWLRDSEGDSWRGVRVRQQEGVCMWGRTREGPLRHGVKNLDYFVFMIILQHYFLCITVINTTSLLGVLCSGSQSWDWDPMGLKHQLGVLR